MKLLFLLMTAVFATPNTAPTEAPAASVIALSSPTDTCKGCERDFNVIGEQKEDFSVIVEPDPDPQEGEEDGDGKCYLYTPAASSCSQSQCHVNGTIKVTNTSNGDATVRWQGESGGVLAPAGGVGQFVTEVLDLNCSSALSNAKLLDIMAAGDSDSVIAQVIFTCSNCRRITESGN